MRSSKLRARGGAKSLAAVLAALLPLLCFSCGNRRAVLPLTTDGTISEDTGIPGEDTVANERDLDTAIDTAVQDSFPADAAKDLGNDTQDAGIAELGSDLPTPDSWNNADATVPSSGFVAIKKGTFYMGSIKTEACRWVNEDRHKVTLTHDFEIMESEVTQGQYVAVMGNNPSYYKKCGLACPVETVTWYQAASYCNALSKSKGLTPCYSCTGSAKYVKCKVATAYTGKSKIYSCPGFRLPTEAEWEYAYRAGTTTAYYNGYNDPTKCQSLLLDANADKIAWYFSNSISMITPRPVMQKQKNGWGLFDMAGNVKEWCHDRHDTYLGFSAVVDPVIEPISYQEQIVRGGSHSSTAHELRAAFRSGFDLFQADRHIGFRVARTM